MFESVKAEDIERIKPMGPWVLIKPDPPKDKIGSLYLPQGNMMERTGHGSGYVVSFGEGLPNLKKNPKTKYIPIGVAKGDRVAFRGYLQEHNRVGKDHCFIHATDIIGILDDDADFGMAESSDRPFGIYEE
jgi:co-chaperonin GroES (HSP10)